MHKEDDRMFVIDEILERLKDGEWHPLEEITTKISLTQFGAQTITSFLANQDFIEFNKEQRKLRLTPLTWEFLNEIQRFEREDMSVFSSP